MAKAATGINNRAFKKDTDAQVISIKTLIAFFVGRITQENKSDTFYDLSQVMLMEARVESHWTKGMEKDDLTTPKST